MANNVTAKDASNVTQTLKTTDNSGVHTSHINVDAIVPGTGATNLGKAEDAAHTSGDTGTFALAVRKDTPAGTAGSAEDYSGLTVDANGRLWARVIVEPVASGGCSAFRLIAAATTNANVVKGAAGQLYGLEIENLSASTRYVKLYDKATSPTVGTDVPVRTIAIRATQTKIIPIPMGLAFTLGIGIAITGGLGDGDTTAIAANDVVLNIDYK